MAITVQSLYNSLNVYRLKLIAGANGLQKHVSWVYYTEDPESIEFIRGGEIEITTGLNVERHKHNTDDKSDFSLEFLTALIKESVDKNASGLIVNTGKYIDVIPQKIISLCDELDFPLFTMPWEIHTIDVMQEIGNKIVNDNQKGQTLEQCFYDVLFHSKNFNSAYLENTSFANASDFSIILMKIPSGLFDDDKDQLKRHIEYSFNNKIGLNPNDFCWLICDNLIVYILHSDPYNIAQTISQIVSNDRVLKGSIVSISSICHSPLELAAEFEHAEVALKFCKPGENFIDYNSLGVFKLFAEVKNPSVLENMYQEILGALDSLSPLKHQSYLETLKFYVEQNGKIQKTAEENSTHRNTINYRIRKISELLNCDLQNGQVRYMIQTALLIGEYLGK